MTNQDHEWRRGSWRWALPVVAVTTLLAGCLLTGTKVFSHEAGSLSLTAGAVAAEAIILRESSTYAEHGDDIKRVDRVGLTTRVVNGNAFAANLTLWVSERGDLQTREEVAGSAIPILTGLSVASLETRDISYEDSLDLLQNVEALQELVQRGEFTLYLTGDAASAATMRDLVLIITFTVGL